MRYSRIYGLMFAIVGLLLTSIAEAAYTGPVLKMPLPGGYSWGLNTIPGSFRTHQGRSYYSIDFDDDKLEDNQSDLGAGIVDVLAAADGYARVYPNSGSYGNKVVIDHGRGYRTIYGHLHNFAIREGNVRQGQVLGKLGDTPGPPVSTGPHVHFEVTHNNDASQRNPALQGVAVEGIRFVDYRVGRYYLSTNTRPFLVTPDGDNPHVCGDLPRGGEGTNQHTYTCQDQRDVFEEGDTVWGLFRINNVRAIHTFLARLCDGDFCPEEHRWTNQVPAGQVWGTAFNWPEFRNVEPGEWEIRWFVDAGAGFRNQPDGIASFSVLADEEVELAGAEGEGQGEGEEPPPPPPPPPGGYLYDGNNVTCLGPITGGDEDHGWVYTCENQTDRFNQNQTAWGLVRIDEVYVPFTFKSETYWFDTYNAEWDRMWGWDGERYTPDAVWGWRHASFSGNAQNPPPGSWQTRVSLDTGNGFQELTRLNFTSTLAGAPYEYRGIYTLCHGPIEAGNANNNWRTTCQNRDMAGVYPVGTTIYGMLEINNVWVRYRMRITITQNGNPWDPWIGDWQHTDTPWMWAAIFPYTGVERMQAGNYTYFFDIDTGNGFVPVDNLSFTVR